MEQRPPLPTQRQEQKHRSACPRYDPLALPSINRRLATIHQRRQRPDAPTLPRRRQRRAKKRPNSYPVAPR